MKLSGRAWLLIAAAILACGAVWLVVYQRARVFAASPAGMLQRLPAQNGVLLLVDLDALRRAGLLKLLSGSKVAEEPEYQAFVRSTGFDYSRDLERVTASFGRDGEFFVVKGRFDWRKLESYARDQGGVCLQSLCRMPGSTGERRISFYPLQPDLMALAASTDSYAASRLVDAESRAVQPLEWPADPVWLSIPGDSLKSADRMPANTQPFASALASADKILISLGPQGTQFEARLAVTCRTSQDAAALLARLESATSLLRDSLARENQKPNAKDLTGVLTAGSFGLSGRRVLGRWPLPSEFLESLAGATL